MRLAPKEPTKTLEPPDAANRENKYRPRDFRVSVYIEFRPHCRFSPLQHSMEGPKEVTLLEGVSVNGRQLHRTNFNGRFL